MLDRLAWIITVSFVSLLESCLSPEGHDEAGGEDGQRGEVDDVDRAPVAGDEVNLQGSQKKYSGPGESLFIIYIPV